MGFEFTGATTYVHNLVSLISGDVDFQLVTFSHLLTAVEARSDIKVVNLNFAAKWPRAIQIPLCMLVLAWLRVWHGMDMVWINGYPEIVLMPWAKVIGCRAIATRHLTLVTNKPKWHWIRNGWRAHFLYERLARFSDILFCVSETVAESLQTCVRRDKLIVIQNWVPLLPEPVSPNQGDHPLRLLFVGRLAKIKGVAVLLEALRRFSSEFHKRGLSLTVVGDGDERMKLEKAAAELFVRFVGFRTDLDTYYRNADVFVNPSLGPEGLPLVSLDAMSYGLPCVLSDLPVHKEISRNGEDALLFQAGNAEDLKEQITMLLDNPELISRYGSLARNAIETRHGAESAHEHYLMALGL